MARFQERSRLRRGGQVKLSVVFTPRFYAEIDRRLASTREVLARVQRLKDDAGCDSRQKEMLMDRKR